MARFMGKQFFQAVRTHLFFAKWVRDSVMSYSPLRLEHRVAPEDARHQQKIQPRLHVRLSTLASSPLKEMATSY